MPETLNKAQLIPMRGDQPDESRAIPVQFNPATLKVGLSNTLKANTRGGNSNTAAQYVDKSSSTLSVELVFDTTTDNTDVRLSTKEIAELFMKPEPQSRGKPKAPARCRFQWGAFAFEGMVQSYDETLDFFAPEGIPLRATLALKFNEDRYQFITEEAEAAERETPSFTPESDPTRVPPEKGGAPSDWRDTALFNGIESPRFPGTAGLMLPSASLSASVGVGLGARASASASFRFGASASLGTGISGAFSSSIGAGVSTGVSAGAGLSTGASLGLGASAGAGAGAAASAGVSAGAGVGAGVRFGAR
jgi:hypothetical protein